MQRERHSTAFKRQAERRGRLAEWIAAAWLTLKGYDVLARRARTPFGEIDLVARRGDVLAMVEVKARRRHDVAREALTARNWRRIAGAADSWRARYRVFESAAIRFDAITIAPWSRPIHLVDAWRPSDR